MKNFIFKINRALVAEKKLFFILAACVAIVFTSCENQGAARAIIGHSYETHNSTEVDVIYFASSGAAQVSIIKSGVDPVLLSHLTYYIKGSTVEVYFDDHEFWKPEYRGELYVAFSYFAEGDYLVDQWGAVYVKVK